MNDRPAPEPSKLLAYWMEWEHGEQTPGRVMANLKTAGLRDLLEDLAAAAPSAAVVTAAEPGAGETAAESAAGEPAAGEPRQA